MKKIASGPAVRRVSSESALTDRAASDAAKENTMLPRVTIGGGKRTLTAEHDLAKQILREREQAKVVRPAVTSKFFSASKVDNPNPPKSSPALSVSEPQSLLAAAACVDEDDLVPQEEGYYSPTGSVAELIDVSSPPSSREPSPEPFDEPHDDASPSNSADDDDVPSPQRDRQLTVYYPLDQAVTPIAPISGLDSSYFSFPTPHHPYRTYINHYKTTKSDKDTDDEPNIAGIKLSQGSSFTSGHSQTLRTATRGDSAADEMHIDVFTDEPKSAQIARPEYVSQPYLSPSNRSSTTVSSNEAILAPDTPHRAGQSMLTPSWGPDLQDLFSPARSEAESVALGSEVASPDARRARSKSRSIADEDEDVFLTPRHNKIDPIYAGNHDFFDINDPADITDIESDAAASGKSSVEAKWREKWALPLLPLTKRKVNSATATLDTVELSY